MSKTTSVKDTKMLPLAVDNVLPEMAARCAAFLRQGFPKDTAKLVARAVNTEERTAKDWLCGQWPNGKHLARMCQVFGPSFVHFVFQPACPEFRVYLIEGKLNDLERGRGALVDSLEKARADFRGGSSESNRSLVHSNGSQAGSAVFPDVNGD